MVENEIELSNPPTLFDEEQAAEELFGDRERRLPDNGFAHLGQNPLQHVRHLKGIGEICLVGSVGERTEDVGDLGSALHANGNWGWGIGD